MYDISFWFCSGNSVFKCIGFCIRFPDCCHFPKFSLYIPVRLRSRQIRIILCCVRCCLCYHRFNRCPSCGIPVRFCACLLFSCPTADIFITHCVRIGHNITILCCKRDISVRSCTCRHGFRNISRCLCHYVNNGI